MYWVRGIGIAPEKRLMIHFYQPSYKKNSPVTKSLLFLPQTLICELFYCVYLCRRWWKAPWFCSICKQARLVCCQPLCRIPIPPFHQLSTFCHKPQENPSWPVSLLGHQMFELFDTDPRVLPSFCVSLLDIFCSVWPLTASTFICFGRFGLAIDNLFKDKKLYYFYKYWAYMFSALW